MKKINKMFKKENKLIVSNFNCSIHGYIKPTPMCPKCDREYSGEAQGVQENKPQKDIKLAKEETGFYAILGTVCGIYEVFDSKQKAVELHKKERLSKKNRIVPCTITYSLPLTKSKSKLK